MRKSFRVLALALLLAMVATPALSLTPVQFEFTGPDSGVEFYEVMAIRDGGVPFIFATLDLGPGFHQEVLDFEEGTWQIAIQACNSQNCGPLTEYTEPFTILPVPGGCSGLRILKIGD